MKKNLLTVTLVSGILFSSAMHAQTTLYGITNANAIFTMNNVATPGSINGPFSVSGVAAGQVLVGLDSRSGNGLLYALAYDSVMHNAELYTISSSGSVYSATAVSGTLASMDLGSTNNVAMDFVSTADNQLRVIGRNGNNYIMNAVNGTVMSTGTSGLSFPSGDLHAGSGIMAATAFTNSFYGSDATTQVGYDVVNNVLVSLDTPKFANLFNYVSNTMHSIGITTGVVFATGSSIGMDVWYDSATHVNSIFMTGNTLLTGAHLYRYDLNGITGTLTDLGAIGSGSLNVRDIAFGAQGASTASVAGHTITGLSLNLRNLIYFDSENPADISRVLPISGVAAGQSMIGIDYAANGNLYGLGYNSVAQTYQLYTIDSVTGMATAVNAAAGSLNLGMDDGSGNYVKAGFRFIPTLTNEIRVLGNNGTVNSRINALTGAIMAADTGIQYITGDLNFGDTVKLSSMAYTGFNGDTSTQLIGFDANNGAMVMFDASNSSSGFGIGSSGYISTGLSLNTVLDLVGHTSAYNNAYMNITYDAAAMSNLGFIASNFSGDSIGQQNYSILYDMSGMLTAYHKTTTAGPTRTGKIGYGTPVRDIAIRRPAISTAVANVSNNSGNDLLVYPNPVESNTRIVLPIASIGNVTVDVIDMNGNANRTYVYAPGSYDLDVDMSRLPAGIYSVRVTGKGVGFYNLKVVKQ